MPPMTVATWNMRQGKADAWRRLETMAANYDISLALLQEAVPPPDDWQHETVPSRDLAWQIKAHTDRVRGFCSAITVLDPELHLVPVTPVGLDQAAMGQFAASHPGQFAVADVLDADERLLMTAISLYGIWDRDERYLFTEATLHRAISDLTVLFQDRARDRILLAGDLNIYWRWDHSVEGTYWAHRYDTVFSRLDAYGLRLVGPYGEAPLPRCDCGAGEDCRHVQTYAYMANPKSKPYQLDYVFSTDALKVMACQVISNEEDWRYSDHLPVGAKLDL